MMGTCPLSSVRHFLLALSTIRPRRRLDAVGSGRRQHMGDRPALVLRLERYAPSPL